MLCNRARAITGHDGNNKEGESYESFSDYLSRRLSAGLGLASPSHAQKTVYMPVVVELSGAGAVSGTNYRDGLLMAIDEVNAKGGILGTQD